MKVTLHLTALNKSLITYSIINNLVSDIFIKSFTLNDSCGFLGLFICGKISLCMTHLFLIAEEYILGFHLYKVAHLLEFLILF